MKFKDYENAEEIKKDISLAEDKVCYRFIQTIIFNATSLIILFFVYFLFKFFPTNNHLSILILSSAFFIMLITFLIVISSMLLNSLSSCIYLVIKLKRWKKQSH